jgi:LysR family hydrogen peroxide-inducible transcriptional activator
MNLQQLEYIMAVDDLRHFARAAAYCHVTQPTLSMMIRKLEEELGLQIFDRTRHPVTPTQEGKEVIQRARLVLEEVRSLREFAGELKGNTGGVLHLGIIPTLAPYLLPLFIRSFSLAHPHLQLNVREMMTDDCIGAMRKGELDIALLSTPLHEPDLQEIPLFEEEFFIYASDQEKLPKKKYLLPSEIDLSKLWLLEEGHCMRGQVLNLCELRKTGQEGGLRYEAGSIETLINLVDKQKGITIIPKLAADRLSLQQQKCIHEFVRPKPVREISLVARMHFPRKRLMHQLKDHILNSLPPDLRLSEPV